MTAPNKTIEAATTHSGLLIFISSSLGAAGD
jgi:hypothetical protein